jgi:hypothetical protein
VADRDRLIELVRRVMSGDFQDEAELQHLVTDFARSVPHPRAADLIFWPNDEFDGEPAPAQVVERALAYRPIEL